MWNQTKENIHAALNELQKACGFGLSESGTAKLFAVLTYAIEACQDEWEDTVEESYKNGSCYDVNALLAGHIEKILVASTENEVNKPSINPSEKIH